MGSKPAPLITTESQAARVMELINRLQGLPPTVKGMEVELKALRALSDLYGLHSTTVNHNDQREYQITFVPQNPTKAALKPADPLDQLDAIPEQELGFASLEPLPDPDLPFARYTPDELLNDPGGNEDPPEDPPFISP